MQTAKAKNEFVTATRVMVRPENRRELCLTISALIERIRHEKGCRTFAFYGEVENQNSLILIGEWDTIDAWENHLHSESFSVLFGSLKLLSNRSKLDFSVLSHVTETEDKVRGALSKEPDLTMLSSLSRRGEFSIHE
jgi:quinol monooxygenase YgiN